MKTLKIICLLVSIGLLIGCATVYDVKYDYDQQTDFAALKTYDWMAVPEKAGMNEFVVQRIKSAVNADLQAKGLILSTDNPDFLIAQHTGKENKVQVTDWGYGYGSYGRYRGGYRGSSRVSTYEYEEGSLILDFVDAKSRKLIWRGTGKADVQYINTPDKSQALIDKAVQKILAKFPPSVK